MNGSCMSRGDPPLDRSGQCGHVSRVRVVCIQPSVLSYDGERRIVQRGSKELIEKVRIEGSSGRCPGDRTRAGVSPQRIIAFWTVPQRMRDQEDAIFFSHSLKIQITGWLVIGREDITGAIALGEQDGERGGAPI